MLKALTLSGSLLLLSPFALATGHAGIVNECSARLAVANDLIKPAVFKEYDIRGVAGTELSPEFAHKLGGAFAEYLHTATAKPAAGRARLTIAVGYDARISGPSYHDALIKGLRESGIDVIDIGMVSTPMTYFAARELDLDGAVMVTASHNPGKYNGFKITVGKEPIFGQKIQALRGLMEKGTSAKPVAEGSLLAHQIIPAYNKFVEANLAKLGLKIDPNTVGPVVIDSTNGVAGLIAPKLYRKLGVTTISMFENPDGNFPNHNPDPSVMANLTAIRAEVVKRKAKFGLAFDGDADRIVLIDNNGEAVSGDTLMALLAKDILKRHPGATIMGEVKMGQVFYGTVEANGGKSIMFRTGAAIMKSEIDPQGVALAGESSGHIIYGKLAGWINTDDAIYVGARIMAILTEDGRPLSEILKPFKGTAVSTPEMRLEVDDAKKFELVAELKKRLLANGYTVNAVDGVRVSLPNGSWGLIRASNTEPALSVRFEAQSAHDLTAVQHMMNNALSEAAAAIGYHKPIREGAGH